MRLHTNNQAPGILRTYKHTLELISLKLTSALLLVTGLIALGQGTILFDQQSSADETPLPYGSGTPMQQLASPWGQSFTPSLPSIGFIRLNFVDGNIVDGLGATVFVNLRRDSISGQIIGTTASVAMASLFQGVSTFVFPSPISLTPGTTYYFDPIVAAGTWNIISGPYDYSGGTGFVGGSPVYGSDLWFREGVFVPEPSSIAIALLGFAALACSRWHF